MFRKLLTAGIISLVAVNCVFAAGGIDLTVKVKDGGGAWLQDVQVMVSYFDEQGNPVPANTKTGKTDGSGTVQFFGLPNTTPTGSIDEFHPYRVFVTKHGYTPTVRDQFMGLVNQAEFVPVTASGTKTITLTAKGTAGIGKVRAEVNLTGDASLPALVFGSVRPMSNEGELAYGILEATDTAGCFLEIYNVPAANANEYLVGAFCPAINLQYGVPIDAAVTAGDVFTSPSMVLDFTDPNAMPPGRTDTSGMGKAAIRGEVRDRVSSEPVTGASLDLEAYSSEIGLGGFNDGYNFTLGMRYHATTDENGSFAFYDIISTSTFFVPPNMEIIYKLSVNRNGYEGIEFRGFGNNGIIYNGFETTLVMFKGNMALKLVNGAIEGRVLMGGNPVPYGWVNVNGDWEEWYDETFGAGASGINGANGWGGEQIKNGNFVIKGLDDGNYKLNIWTEFYPNGMIEYNTGKNGVNEYEYGVHGKTGDDMRITVKNGNCEVYLSSGGVYITTYVVVEIPVPTIEEVDKASIDGSISLVSGGDIDPGSPVTIIAHENWNSYNGVTESTEPAVVVSSDDAGTIFIKLANNHVSFDGLTVECATGTYISGEPTGGNSYWTDWETGEIWWDPSNPNQPAVNTTVKVMYKYEISAKTAFENVSGSQKTFSIPVCKGYKYQIEIKSGKYGVIWKEGMGDLNADLTLGTSFYILPHIELSEAGSIRGMVRLPNLQVFKPTRGNGEELYIDIEAAGVNTQSRGNTGVGDDGIFIMEGLLPGTYNLKTRTGGYGSVMDKVNWAEGTLKNVTVKVSSEPTNVVIYLKEGVPIRCNWTDPGPVMGQDLINQVVNYFEEATIKRGGFEKSGPDSGGIGAFGIPSGTELTADVLKKMFMTEPEIGIGFNPFTGEWEQPKMVAPGNYDFYFGCARMYDPGLGVGDYNLVCGAVKKGVIVDKSLLKAGTDYVEVYFDKIVVGSSTLIGTITGSNIVTQENVAVIKNDFNKFFSLIPSIFVYDSNGEMRGFAVEMPPATPAAGAAWKTAAASGDMSQLQQAWTDYPLKYRMRFLPAGAYKVVAVSPNYPPRVRNIVLQPDTTVNLNIDLDQEAGAGSTLTGVVTSTDGVTVIAGASVLIKTKGYEKTVTTNSDGVYKAEGLMLGMYGILVSMSGYAPVAVKQGIPAPGTYTVNFQMTQGGASLTGKVYSKLLPPTVAEGAKVVAFYDEVENAGKVNPNPGSMIPLYSATTDSEGNFEISGLINGYWYKLFIVVPGKRIKAVSFRAGVLIGASFTLEYIPPSFDVRYEVIGSSVIFKIKSFTELTSLDNVQYSAGATFNSGAPLAVSGLTQVTSSSDTYSCSVLLADNNTYTLKVEGTNEAGTDSATINFSLGYKQIVKAILDTIIAEGGDILIDDTGADPSMVTIPVGGIDEESGTGASGISVVCIDDNVKYRTFAIGGAGSAIMNFSKQSKESAGAMGTTTGLISDIYSITMENAAINKEITVSLYYDATGVDNTANLNIRQYNETTGQWEMISGVVTVNSMDGTVSVDVSSSSILGTSSIARAGYGAMATVDLGSFAVFSALPQGAAYSGAEFKMYNFPNPFDLKSKQVTETDTASGSQVATITGTMLKYYLPSDKTGDVKIYIYNIAGELVCTISEGTRNGGYVYYAEWDGKNSSGEDCASGVYFVNVKLDGSKLNSKVHKIALIK